MDILIIEDEQDILNGMKEAVQQLDERIDRVFAVDNAEIAIELIREHRPQIIVTDIVLPQMTGLDLMEQMQEKDYHPKIIVVSGYSNFSYAQRSIKLGAVDYMLKPFERQEFMRKIQSLIDLIYEEQELLSHMKQDSGSSLLGTRTLRDKFILGLCTNSSPLNENMVHRLKFFDIEWLADSTYSIIAIDRIEQAKEPLTEKEFELKVFAIGNVVEEVLQACQPFVLFRNIHHQWIVIMDSDAIDEMTEAIISAIRKYQYIEVCIGISNPMNAFQSIAKAYEQAIQAMKLAHVNKQGHKLSFSDIEGLTVASGHKSDVELMAEYVYMDQPKLIEEAVIAVLHTLTLTVGTNDRQALSQRCMEWVIQVHAALADKLRIKQHQISIQVWVDIDLCEDYEQLKTFLIHYFMELSQQITAAPMNPIIEKGTSYLKSNYASNITLQGLATELSVHPVWLSQLFKRETKVTFSQYLTELRMEEAKRLLQESNLKIYEIAEQVGYTDLQHFGQVFKKKTGATPKEFRQRL